MPELITGLIKCAIVFAASIPTSLLVFLEAPATLVPFVLFLLYLAARKEFSFKKILFFFVAYSLQFAIAITLGLALFLVSFPIPEHYNIFKILFFPLAFIKAYFYSSWFSKKYIVIFPIFLILDAMFLFFLGTLEL